MNKHQKKNQLKIQRKHAPALITLIYVLLGSTWFFISDHTVTLITLSTSESAFLQTVKGTVLILASAFLLYFLLWRQTKRIEQSEKALHESEAHYHALFDSNPQPMWVFDLQTLGFLAVNRAATKRYGYTREQFLAMTIKDIRPKDALPELFNNLARGVDSPRIPNLVRHVKSNGEIIDVEILSHNILFAERPARLILASDVTERLKAQAALRVSEENYRRVVETAKEGIWILDADALVTYANPRMANLLGYEVEEMLGRPLYDFMEEGQRAAARFKFEQCKAGLAKQEDYRLLSKSGATIWTIVSSNPIYDHDGKPSGTLGMVTDITERKYMEEALQDSEQKYRSVIENVKEVVFQIDNQKRWTFLNPAWSEMTGISVSDTIGKPFTERIYVEDQLGLINLFDLLLAGKRNSCRYRVRYSSVNDELRWISVFARPTRDNAGNIIGATGTLTDITERKRAEDELRVSEERFRVLFENSPISLWEQDFSGVYDYLKHLHECGVTDFKSYFSKHADDVKWCLSLVNVVDVNEASIKLYQADSEEQLIRDFHQRGGDHTIELFKEQLVAIANGQTRFSYEGFDYTLKGEKIYVAVNWQLAPGAEKTYAKLLVSIADITALKHADEQLRKLSLAVEQSANMVMITDPRGVIEYVNPKFCEVTEFSLSELLGKNVAMLKSREIPASTYYEIWKTLRSGKEWHGELHNRKKNGEFYWCLESISPVRDTSGTITHYVSVAEDISERKYAESTIRHLAYYDPLTGLPNRRLFRDRLDQAMTVAARNDSLFALMYLDLDRFKTVNDTLGHEVGDRLLVNSSQRMAECLRKGDTIARLGGDEFAVIITEVAHLEDIPKIADKIIAAMQRPFMFEGHELFISTSVGISVFPNDSNEPETLIKNADIALYRAKEQGRNTFQFYRAEMNAQALERLVLENRLRRALEREEFVLYYQPQIDLRTGQIVGMEALLRWLSPELGLVLPKEFVYLAEETGLIVPIGEWVLKTACVQGKRWQEMGLPGVRFAVNLSARQFRNKALESQIAHAIEYSGFDPKYLELELTESIIMENPNQTQTILNSLREIGVSFTIDDFGTGYSSLSYLKHFPLDKLKIDQAFVRDIVTDPDDAAIVRAIIRMAHSLKLKVLAEGVESNGQVGFLQSHGCEQAQGFGFSKPLTPEQVDTLIKNGSILRLEDEISAA